MSIPPHPPASAFFVVSGDFALDALVAALIVFAADAVARGVAGTSAWIIATPAPYIAVAVFTWMWIRGFQVVIPRSLAYVTALVFAGTIAIAGQVKMAKLGAPLSAPDLLLVDQLIPTAQMLWGPGVLILAAAICVFGIVLSIFLAWRARGHALHCRRTRIINAVFLLTAIALIWTSDFSGAAQHAFMRVLPVRLSEYGIANYRFAPLINVERNGQLLVFLFELRPFLRDQTSVFMQPLGYGRERVKQILTASSAPLPARPVPTVQAENVVVIMNEAWWDPAQLPGVTYSDPLLGAADASSRGMLYSPTFGGYTVNTEFEFLTRLSTAFLPQGSIPFQQYVLRPLPSLVADFYQAGYQTIAIHPYDGTFWNRNVVYPLLGFQRFITQENFVAPELVPPYISDMELGRKVIATLESNSSQRNFIFAVSMQNHAPYAGMSTRYAANKLVDVVDHSGRLSATNLELLRTYASGVRDAVIAFNAVVGYLRAAGRPAVVVMFGDHLPFLGDHYGPYLQSGFISTESENAWSLRDRHRIRSVPVIAWSNTPQGVPLPPGPRSMIFLSTDIKRGAGLPLSPIDAVLERVARERLILTRDGPEAKALVAEPKSGPIADFYMIQYDLLSGSGYSTCLLRPALCVNNAQ